MGIHVINCCGQTMAGGWLLGDSTTQHHNPWAGSYHCLTSIHDPTCFWHCSIDLNCNLSWHLFGAWKGDCKRVRKREREINININIYIYRNYRLFLLLQIRRYTGTQRPNNSPALWIGSRAPAAAAGAAFDSASQAAGGRYPNSFTSGAT